MMKIILSVFFLAILSACTYSITMVHTEGSASDVVDETQTSTPEVNASLSLPIKSI